MASTAIGIGSRFQPRTSAGVGRAEADLNPSAVFARFASKVRAFCPCLLGALNAASGAQAVVTSSRAECVDGLRLGQYFT